MNKQTSILVAFALAFFVAFALTANEILSNDNLKTEITTSDKSTETTCSSKIEKILMLPDDMSGKEIVDRITTKDLFSTKKIFIIRDPQKI